MSDIPDPSPDTLEPTDAIDTLARTARVLLIERDRQSQKLRREAIVRVVFGLGITLPSIIFLPAWAAVGAAVLFVLVMTFFIHTLLRDIFFFSGERAGLIESMAGILRQVNARLQDKADPGTIHPAELDALTYAAELDQEIQRNKGGRPRLDANR